MSAAQALAAAINGIEYDRYFTASMEQFAEKAKAAGLVIAFGASDDLLEFEGAIRDEVGAWNGATALVDAEGVLPSFEQAVDRAGDDEDEMERYVARKKAARIIEAVWSDDGAGYAWTIKTDIPHETFAIMEDGEGFSRGIVFALADLVPVPAEPVGAEPGTVPAPTGPQFAKVFQTERGQIVAMLHQDSEQNPAVLLWFDAGIEGLALTHLALGFTNDEDGEAKARDAFDKLDPAGVERVVFKQIDNIRAHFGGAE